MNVMLSTLMGLVIGYLVGIGLAAIAVFVFGFEDAARFIAIGCGLLGAVLGAPVARAMLRER
jgi:hypothetical protein